MTAPVQTYTQRQVQTIAETAALVASISDNQRASEGLMMFLKGFLEGTKVNPNLSKEEPPNAKR